MSLVLSLLMATIETVRRQLSGAVIHPAPPRTHELIANSMSHADISSTRLADELRC
jgi:hypothetical protein